MADNLWCGALCTALLILLSPGVGAATAVSEQALTLSPVADIPLPGSTSRFDYESYDPDRHLLFIAHLGDDEVLAIDVRTRRLVSRIGNLSRVHGVLAIPELGRIYASATGTDEVVAIDETHLDEIARAPGGTYPDGMAYVPKLQKLYVSDETGRTETVIDVRSNRRIATIPLQGEVGNSQYDPVSRHVLVNVQSSAQLVEIDPVTDRVVLRTDLPGARGNHGLLIESARRLAFVACEDNDRLLVVDLKTHQIRNNVKVSSGPDVLAFDPGLQLLYVASESGPVAWFRLGAEGLSRIADVDVAPNAHGVAVNPDSHEAYFPIRNLNGHPALRIVQPVH